MENSFKGAVQFFANRGIHFLFAEGIKFRKQLTVRNEFKSQSGWSDSLNTYIQNELENLSNTVENITYFPEDKTQEQLEMEAADTERSLAEDYSVRSLQNDNVLMPVGDSQELIFKLDDSDPNIPQMTEINCPNDFGRGLIKGLDYFLAEATRLDSRHQPQTITKYESVMLRSRLVDLYALTARKGGEENRSDIPSGTLPSDEPDTFQG